MTTPPVKSTNWLQLLRKGQRYMKSWPKEKRLAVIFPENRVTRATQFGVHFMPPIAVFTLCWQIALGSSLGLAVATALFACSLPMQGLWWLGRRSITPLNTPLADWYFMLRERLVESGQVLIPLEQAPTYQNLADALRLAFVQLDKTFLDDL